MDAARYSARGLLLEGLERGVGVSIFTLLLMGLVATLEATGLLERLVEGTRLIARTPRAAEGLIVGVLSAAVMLTTHSVVAILAVGPYARDTGARLGLTPYRRANLLDLTACTWPFLLPWFIPTILAASTTAAGEAAGLPRLSPLAVGFANALFLGPRRGGGPRHRHRLRSHRSRTVGRDAMTKETTLARVLAVLAAFGLATPALRAAPPVPASPGREPVLKQIKVPHRYYYREMYLPQLTSGPSSAAWSGDGRELVFSMQGSLWRTVPGSGLAQQITDGPGYHYQPDWSSDGRFVAFAAYDKDAVEIQGLDLQSGEQFALTTGGAVNLEPRFSPDGKRLAFVSTAHEGRFHLFVLPLANGRPAGPPQRVSEDKNSGLPRYYYSRFRPLPLAVLVTRRPGAALPEQPRPHLGVGRVLARPGPRRAPAKPRCATRRPRGRRGPTGRATAGGSSTAPTSAGSGTSSGS